ncbi:MAG: ATPase, T2SS/T4P/T4SS family, partial [Thermoplasmata archaeon]
MKIVPDTSVIIDGRITTKVREGEFNDVEVIIPEAVISELEAQANRGKETGMSGLEEIQEIRKLSEEGKIKLFFEGERPGSEAHELADKGEIDSIIRSIALDEDAKLVTSDLVQAEVAKAKGLNVEYLKPVLKKEERGNDILEYFTDETMSVHLREGTKPTAKKGTPGDIRTEIIKEEISSRESLQTLAHNIIENAKRSSKGFIEVDKGGATVVQLENIRIVIARPPFSDGFEITAVRPVAKVALEDYKLSEELKKRFTERQRGVLLAGSPGAGKSTLAQAIADYLKEDEFTVKTMEDPRDLQVGDE